MPVQQFTVTPAVTVGAYSANDVVGGLMTFKGLRRGSLQTVTITDKAAQSVDYLLVVFNDTPTGISDNDTFDIADGDLTKIIRKIELTAASHRQAFTDNAVYSVPQLDIPLQAQCPSISAFLITTGAPTYASTSDISVVLQVDTDYVSGRNQGTTNVAAISVGDAASGELGGNFPSPTVDTTHSGSTHANLPSGAQANSVNLVTISSTDTLSNKTLTTPTIGSFANSAHDHADAAGGGPLGTGAVNTITDLASGIKSGVDATVITGTAGTNGDLAQWDGNGDLIDGPTGPSSDIVGISDSQTLTNKTFVAANNTLSLTTDSVDAITEVAAAIKSGSDGTLVTGTPGGAGVLAMWDANGDAIVASGAVFINDTAAGNITTGLAVNQGGADDSILEFKSSDIAHGITTGLGIPIETDTYFQALKQNAILGGTRLLSVAEDAATSVVLDITSVGGTADATKSTAGRSLVEVEVFEHDGSNGIANVATDGNVFGVRARSGGSTLTRMLVDETGDLYSGNAAQTFDEYDDLALLENYDKVRSGFTGWTKENEQQLIDLKILGAPVSEGGLVNQSQLIRLLVGAVRQMGDRLEVAEYKLERRKWWQIFRRPLAMLGR